MCKDVLDDSGASLLFYDVLGVCDEKAVIGVTLLWDAERDSYCKLPGYLAGLEGAGMLLPLGQSQPILGICRGIQFFNAFLGGSLYQDLPIEHSSEVLHSMRPRPMTGRTHRPDPAGNTPGRTAAKKWTGGQQLPPPGDQNINSFPCRNGPQ